MTDRVAIVVMSKFFTLGKSYEVRRWHDDCPQVRNDVGTFTWLLDPRQWIKLDPPMTQARSQKLLHERYLRDREQWA